MAGDLDTPILEETGLFVRGVGKQTDIVEKELYSLRRWAATVSSAPGRHGSGRSAPIQHGMFNQPQPVKFSHVGPMLA